MVTKFVLILFLIHVQTGEQGRITVQKYADSYEICRKAALTTALELVEEASEKVITSYQCKQVRIRES